MGLGEVSMPHVCYVPSVPHMNDHVNLQQFCVVTGQETPGDVYKN
jgi:hypothetical protein